MLGRRSKTVLTATADPLLDAELAQAAGISLISAGCETGTECLELVSIHSPEIVVLSPAVAPFPGALIHLVRELRQRYPHAALAVIAGPEEAAALQSLGVAAFPPSGQIKAGFESWLRSGAPAAAPPQQHAPPPQPLAPPPAPAYTEPPKSGGIRWPALPLGTRHEAPVAQVPSGPIGKVVTLWGGKPGTGRSTLLVGIGDLIARTVGARVCLVDLNGANSSLATLLGQAQTATSWPLLVESILTGQLTKQALLDSLLEVAPRLHLLTGPAVSEQWAGLLTDQLVTDIASLLKEDFDYILLDPPAGRSPIADEALRLAQQVILVVSAFYPDVVDTTRVLEQAAEDGVLTRDRCRLILSPWLDGPELPVGDVSECLGLPISAVVPMLPAAALAAARTGRPVTQLDLSEGRTLSDAIMTVAGMVSETGISRQTKRNWFSR